MSSRFYFNSLKTNSKIAFQFLPVIIVNDIIEFSTYNFIANSCSFFDFRTIFVVEKRYNLRLRILQFFDTGLSLI